MYRQGGPRDGAPLALVVFEGDTSRSQVDLLPRCSLFASACTMPSATEEASVIRECHGAHPVGVDGPDRGLPGEHLGKAA
jgi:hypothetical protein